MSNRIMSDLKIGNRIEMIENCTDNPYITRGRKGTIIDFHSYDDYVYVEFDRMVTGECITGNGRDNYNWYIEPEQLKVI